MKPLLPFLFIADAEHDPFRVRYRLVGTRAVEVTGFDITGHYLDELLSAEPDQPWMNHYRQAYVSRKPVLGTTIVPTNAGGMLTYEFHFPLAQGSSFDRPICCCRGLLRVRIADRAGRALAR